MNILLYFFLDDDKINCECLLNDNLTFATIFIPTYIYAYDA